MPYAYVCIELSSHHFFRPAVFVHQDRRHLLNRFDFFGLCNTLSGEEGGVSSSFLIDSALSLPVLDWKLASEGLVSLGASAWTRRLVLERE